MLRQQSYVFQWRRPDTIYAMNPVAMYFASGESLHFGATLLVLVVAVSPFLKRSWLFDCVTWVHGWRWQ